MAKKRNKEEELPNGGEGTVEAPKQEIPEVKPEVKKVVPKPLNVNRFHYVADQGKFFMFNEVGAFIGSEEIESRARDICLRSNALAHIK